MPAKALLIILIFIGHSAFSQYKAEEKRLLQKEGSARSATQKIRALGQLAELYYIYRADEKADSVLQKQLATAELANDKELILEVLFNNAISHIEKWSGKETFERLEVYTSYRNRSDTLNQFRAAGQRQSFASPRSGRPA